MAELNNLISALGNLPSAEEKKLSRRSQALTAAAEMVGQPQGVGGAILKGLLAGQAVKTGEKADELASDRTNKLKELIQQQIDVAQKNQALKQKVEMQKVLKEAIVTGKQTL